MMVLPMNEIYAHPSDMLAVMANKVGGGAFRTVLCVDAVIILCGGCLTAYVGVTGLLNRLALDSVLPAALSLKNSRDSPYVSVIVFALLSISLFVAIFDPTNPTAINNFGGVFAISFISVLIAFASVTILLKLYRPRLARQVIAKWWEVFFSIVAVSLGLAGWYINKFYKFDDIMIELIIL
jgi:amino acid transporter